MKPTGRTRALLALWLVSKLVKSKPTPVSLRAQYADRSDLPKKLREALDHVKAHPKKTAAKNVANRLCRLFQLWEANDEMCYICQKPMPFDMMSRDHVFPKSEGFALYQNSAPACKACNVKKNHQWPTLAQIWRAVKIYRRMDEYLDPRFNNSRGLVTIRFAPRIFALAVEKEKK